MPSLKQACMLTLSLTCGLCFATANPHNSTAVSETYEGVHIAEANRKSAVGERKLEDMLHWAIEHSDATKLKQQAEVIGSGSGDLTERQQEIQQELVLQLIKQMQSMPTETELMKDAIAVLVNTSTPAQEALVALEAIQVLVEPIDNANDLHSLEGLSPVVKLLTEDAPALQAAAAYVLGTAASNNNKFQELLMQHHPESINLLMQVSKSNSSEASRKGLYALATLLRNNDAARQHFYQHSGIPLLTMLLKQAAQSEAVQRKLFNLVADLSQADLHKQTSKADRQGLLAAIHPHACDSLDAVAEEALLAVKGILECSTSDAKELADDSGTHEALHSMKRELKSHLNSVAHVESYVVDNLQCQRDLLQLCTAIDSMPSLQEGSGTKLSKSSGHEEL